MKELIAQDVLMMVGWRDGCSYKTLCEDLAAYDAQMVISVINALSREGKLAMTPQGFQVASGIEEAGETPCAEEDEEPGPAVGHGIEEAVAESAELSGGHETMPSDEDSLLTRERRQAALLDASKGSILATTPVAFLGFDDAIRREVEYQGIYTVFDLVGGLEKLERMLGRDRASKIAYKLLTLSGAPSFELQKEDVARLCCLSRSPLFYFDLFGVLCASVPRDWTERQLCRHLSDGGLRSADVEIFTLAEYAKRYDDDVFDAAMDLRLTLEKSGYPINGDAFSVFMLPLMKDSFEIGEYETVEEAVSGGAKLVAESSQTVRACFAMLRDDFDRIKQRAEGRPTAETLAIIEAPCFVRAAEKLSDIDATCVYDKKAHCLRFASSYATSEEEK